MNNYSRHAEIAKKIVDNIVKMSMMYYGNYSIKKTLNKNKKSNLNISK